MLTFYDFGVGSGGGLSPLLHVAAWDTGTATSVQNVTNSNIGGATPSAVMAILTGQAAGDAPAESANCSFSIGALDASGSSGSIAGFSEAAQTSSDCYKRTQTSQWFHTLSGSGGLLKQPQNPALISNGFSTGFLSNNGVSDRALWAAFSGIPGAKTGRTAMNTGTTAISGVGFTPDLVIAYGINFQTAGSTANSFSLNFGIATADETQRTVSWQEDDAVASGGNPVQVLWTDRIIGQLTHPATDAYAGVADNFNSDGFDVVMSANGGGDFINWIALDLGSRQCKIVDFTTPTSTGNAAITGAGFTPSSAIIVITNLEAANSIAGSTNDNQGGFGIGIVNASEAQAAAFRINSGADPTDTASNVQGVALLGPSATSCEAIKATLVSFGSDGMTLNYSAVQAAGKKGFVLFIE